MIIKENVNKTTKKVEEIKNNKTKNSELAFQ